MKIAVGSDHRGYNVKNRIVNTLHQGNHDVLDVGTDTEEAVDYPDVAAKVVEQIVSGHAERGVLICGTGIGMSMAANKFAGIRAAAVHDGITAELSRTHNDCNVLCLSADMLGQRSIDHIVQIFLETEFQAGRHSRRIEKIRAIESNGRMTNSQ